MRLRFFFAAAMLVLPLQSQALADGSIAVARSKDDLRFNMGVSYDAANRADADDEALRQCQAAEASVPAADRGVCTLIASYDNMCMALAQDRASGGTAWGWGSNVSQAAAEDRALAECRNINGARQCEITMRHCDGGGGK